mmetsp:Transcript_46557/g.101353  ORF Transcript_46557/g.101353 Transcript_46557/m.101353 type:complete len:214 (-) Transcript_46557:1065-1706(-)
MGPLSLMDHIQAVVDLHQKHVLHRCNLLIVFLLLSSDGHHPEAAFSCFDSAQVLHETHASSPLHAEAIPHGLPHMLQILEAQDLIDPHGGFSQLLRILEEALLSCARLVVIALPAVGRTGLSQQAGLTHQRAQAFWNPTGTAFVLVGRAKGCHDATLHKALDPSGIGQEALTTLLQAFQFQGRSVPFRGGQDLLGSPGIAADHQGELGIQSTL